MKKVYIEPEIQEVELHSEGVLLAGTIQQKGDTPTFNMDGGLDDDPDAEEEGW